MAIAKNKYLVVCYCFIIILFQSMANNKSVALEYIKVDAAAIKLSGEIKIEDADIFQNYLAKMKIKKVILSSGGGNLISALSIGSLINSNDIETVVEENNTCASACALIWVAGVKRIVGKNSKIGFHAAYNKTENKLEISSSANALIGVYLYKLGLPQQTIIFMTEAAPTDMRWLTTKDGNRLGLEFYSETEVTHPDQEPIYISKSIWRQSILQNPIAQLFAKEKPRDFDEFVESTYKIYIEKDNLKIIEYLIRSDLIKYIYTKLQDAEDDILIQLAERKKQILKYALNHDLTLCSNDLNILGKISNNKDFELSDNFYLRLINGLKSRPKIEVGDFAAIFKGDDYKNNLKKIVDNHGQLAMAIFKKYNNDTDKFNKALENPDLRDSRELRLSCYVNINLLDYLSKNKDMLAKFMRWGYQNSFYDKGKVIIKLN